MGKKIKRLIGKHAIRMEYLQRYPDTARATEWKQKNVKIFSSEHGYYWRGTGQGYTGFASESDTITCENAYRKTGHCGPEKGIWFIDAEHAIDIVAPTPQYDYRLVRQLIGK